MRKIIIKHLPRYLVHKRIITTIRRGSDFTVCTLGKSLTVKPLLLFLICYSQLSVFVLLKNISVIKAQSACGIERG